MNRHLLKQQLTSYEEDYAAWCAEQGALCAKGEYELARWSAIQDTGLSEATFPVACPFSIEQVLDPAFLPE